MLRFLLLLIFLYVLLAISESVLHIECGPVCAMNCEHGNELDKNGCPTCTCRKHPEKSTSPCGDRQVPLNGYFCGRGPNHHNCPSTHRCVTAPTDTYAVCCPRHRHRKSSI